MVGETTGRSERIHSNGEDPYRTRFEQDRDRLLYSAGFRRLAGITQIAAAGEAALLHNRLTHSLKVGQVGRRLAEMLKQQDGGEALELDPDLVEVAGLAHDIGHPPFGHVAERELNRQLTALKAGGFEGNAQSLRYVAKTAMRKSETTPGEGALDLTRGSLNSLIKYPRCECDDPFVPEGYNWLDRNYGPPQKWNAYDIDAEVFEWVRQGSEPGKRSLEAALMDWSDDISYAVHDFEDYVRARLIPAHALKRDLGRFGEYAMADMTSRYGDWGFNADKAQAAIELIGEWEVDEPYSGSRLDENLLNDWVSARITSCLEATSVEGGLLRIDEDQQYLIEVLKRVPVFYVIESPPFAAAQLGQCRLIGELFEHLMEMLQQRPHALPKSLEEMVTSVEAEPKAAAERAHNSDFAPARAVSDYLCTLTEPQVFELHARLRGSSPSMFHAQWI